MKDNPCVRFDHIDLDGNKVYKPKKCFDTDVEAIAYCKQMNKRWIDKFIHKLVAYRTTIVFRVPEINLVSNIGI